MRIFLSALCVSLLGLAVGAQTPAAPSQAKAAAKKAPAKKAAPAVPKTPRPDGLYTNISTSVGDITLKLYEEQAPVTVKNFLGLATGRKSWIDPKTQQRVSRPLYNGLTFHRVIPGFMIQGGDPTGTGMGGTDVIKDEFVPTLKFDQPGRLAMANAGPHTGSCQFFITEGPPSADAPEWQTHHLRAGRRAPGRGRANRARAEGQKRQARRPGGDQESHIRALEGRQGSPCVRARGNQSRRSEEEHQRSGEESDHGSGQVNSGRGGDC
jgi:cyclophilin family peptidyl-prolyl cis-trans isomerase